MESPWIRHCQLVTQVPVVQLPLIILEECMTHRSTLQKQLFLHSGTWYLECIACRADLWISPRCNMLSWGGIPCVQIWATWYKYRWIALHLCHCLGCFIISDHNDDSCSVIDLVEYFQKWLGEQKYLSLDVFLVKYPLLQCQYRACKFHISLPVLLSLVETTAETAEAAVGDGNRTQEKGTHIS